MAGIEHRRQQQLRDFVSLCDQVGFHLHPFQVKIAGDLLGREREKLITLPRKNGLLVGKSRGGEEVVIYQSQTPERSARLSISMTRAKLITSPAVRATLRPMPEPSRRRLGAYWA